MKKCLLALFIFTALPVFSQATLYEGFYNAPAKGNLFSAVKRAVYKLPRYATPWGKQVQWVKAVKNEEHQIERLGPLGSSCYAVTTQQFEQRPVEGDPQIYQQRLELIQQAVAQNATLSKYTFVVPEPSDLATLSTDQIRHLQHFLQQPDDKTYFETYYTPRISRPQEGVVVLTLGRNAGITGLVLRIDSRTHTVYFFQRVR